MALARSGSGSQQIYTPQPLIFFIVPFDFHRNVQNLIHHTFLALSCTVLTRLCGAFLVIEVISRNCLSVRE